MIEALIYRESKAGDGLTVRTSFRLAVDAPYSPDVLDDLARRVVVMSELYDDDDEDAELEGGAS